MKLSKKALLIVVVVILAVALGILFSIYFGQNGERAQLNERLSAAQASDADNKSKIKTKEGELTQAESSLDASRSQFPESVESIEYDDDLFEIADDCNVSLMSVTASKPSSKTVGAVTYTVSSFALTVQGSIGNILDFIYALRTGDDFQLPWAAEVTKITTNVSGGSATINLFIYGYEG